MSVRSSGIVAALLLWLALAPCMPAQTPRKPLPAKENPLLIGRRDLNKRQLNFYSWRKEVELGRQLAAEIERQVKLVTDPVVTEYVNRLGQQIVTHSDAKVAFTIRVVDSAEVNAYALPGGILYVSRGLLEAAESEAELAAVMAHEIAHVAARHGAEQMSKIELANWGSIALVALGAFGGWGGVVIRQVAGLTLPLGFLKFSRGAEKEADMLGAQYLWAAGYDPQAFVTFFERLQTEEGQYPGFITRAFSTHPMTSDRVRTLRRLLERFPEREEYLLSSSEFNDARSCAISHGESGGGGVRGLTVQLMKHRNR
jgi:predicted Zn-dependent protease